MNVAFRFLRRDSPPTPLWLVIFFLLGSLVSAQQSAPAPNYPPTVVFMTDFGVVDDSVAHCKGVMSGITPNLRLVDHPPRVTPLPIQDGVRFPFGATPYFPAGAGFVAVI